MTLYGVAVNNLVPEGISSSNAANYIRKCHIKTYLPEPLF